MKRIIAKAVICFTLLSIGYASAAPMDPMWMFSDNTGGKTFIFANFRICDTARNGDFLCFALESDQLPDTGDAYEGIYINFDYQFNSTDTLIIKNEFDSTIIDYHDTHPRPGYAGFKTAWDYGMTGFPISRYKYLIFAHKGPNPNHKVTVRSWYNNGDCGAPSFNEYLGTFNASTSWKIDTIVIPDEVRNKPDKERNTSKYYELVFIINNLDPADTTSGPPGNLKIDDMKLVGCNPIDSSPQPQAVNEGETAAFRVVASKSNAGDVITYQWKKDGSPIAGANSPVYTITAARPADAGMYTVDVKVSTTGLTFTSNGATLSVTAGTTGTQVEEKEGCGCGSGTGMALIVPIIIKAAAYRRKRKPLQTGSNPA